MTCKTCKYNDRSICRRYPPNGKPSGWASVRDDEWCGEYSENVNIVLDVAPSSAKEKSGSTATGSTTAKTAEKKLYRVNRPDLEEIRREMDKLK